MNVRDMFVCPGIALGSYPPSPMSQYPPPISHSIGGGVAHVNEGSASASPPELSPTATSDSATTYNTQVASVNSHTHTCTLLYLFKHHTHTGP